MARTSPSSRRQPTVEPESFLPLHPLEFQILLCLSEESTHAYSIVRTIEARQPAWSRILPTNLYRRIWRLADTGLVDEVDGAEPSERRRHLAITPLGRQVAVAEATRLRELLSTARQAGIVPAKGNR